MSLCDYIEMMEKAVLCSVNVHLNQFLIQYERTYTHAEIFNSRHHTVFFRIFSGVHGTLCHVSPLYFLLAVRGGSGGLCSQPRQEALPQAVYSGISHSPHHSQHNCNLKE